MSRRLLALSLTLALSGCASLQTNGHLDVMKILNDAQWGVLAACEAQWLQPSDCTLAQDALTIASDIVAKNVPMVGPAVKKALVDFEAGLPATSRVRAYLDAVIVLLAS